MVTLQDHRNLLKTGITSTNKRTKIVEGMSYKTTLKGKTLATDTVAVTMGGVTITSSAYTAATGVVKIDKVTGDITITVS